MSPLLIVTNAYVAFKFRESSIIEIFCHAETLAITPVILGELLSRFECGGKIKNRDELQEFLELSRIRMLSLSSDTANFYSQIYAAWRKRVYRGVD